MSRSDLLLLLIPAAYLLGSIPFGLLVGNAKGIDPRRAGSGNIGATNVGRLLGAKFFALVFSLDLLKGALPTIAAGSLLGFHAPDRSASLLWIAAGFAAIAGHLYSIFLHFKGGKGVATSAGVILGIFPYFTFPTLVGIAAWLIIFRRTRYVSVASMLGSFIFALAYILLAALRHWPLAGAQLPFLCFSILVPLLIAYKHRANLARLRAGTENRFASKSL